MSTDTSAAGDPATTDSTFAGRLTEARKAAGLTQEQLGKGMGNDGRDLGKGAVWSWEQGISQPNAAQLSLMCQRLAVTANWLLLGQDKKAA